MSVLCRTCRIVYGSTRSDDGHLRRLRVLVRDSRHRMESGATDSAFTHTRAIDDARLRPSTGTRSHEVPRLRPANGSALAAFRSRVAGLRYVPRIDEHAQSHVGAPDEATNLICPPSATSVRDLDSSRGLNHTHPLAGSAHVWWRILRGDACATGRSIERPRVSPGSRRRTELRPDRRVMSAQGTEASVWSYQTGQPRRVGWWASDSLSGRHQPGVCRR